MSSRIPFPEAVPCPRTHGDLALALQIITTINALFDYAMPLLLGLLASQTSVHALDHLGEAHAEVQAALVCQREVAP